MTSPPPGHPLPLPILPPSPSVLSPPRRLPKADVGLISATGLTGASVSMVTSVGAISAAFAAAPATVRATARVGAITLRVPGTASYQVSADAHIGKAAVSVPQSASSAHAITATTDVGAIVIAPLP